MWQVWTDESRTWTANEFVFSFKYIQNNIQPYRIDILILKALKAFFDTFYSNVSKWIIASQAEIILREMKSLSRKPKWADYQLEQIKWLNENLQCTSTAVYSSCTTIEEIVYSLVTL